MKKRTDFFILLNNQCELMEKAMGELHRYCTAPEGSIAESITQLEHDADDIRRTLIENLNHTYITPIDREDLFNLSRQLDEIIDYIKTSVDEILLFNITPNQDIESITGSLLEMTKHISEAVQNIAKEPQTAKTAAILVKKYENKIDALTKHAYATLFENDDFKMIFKYAEIYRHLNHTADVADSAMDFLLDILVKM